jgi:hypothetical protein
MGVTNGLKDPARVTAPVASSTLSVNVFTAPGKAIRPGPVRSDDGAIPGLGSQPVMVDVWISGGMTHIDG